MSAQIEAGIIKTTIEQGLLNISADHSRAHSSRNVNHWDIWQIVNKCRWHSFSLYVCPLCATAYFPSPKSFLVCVSFSIIPPASVSSIIPIASCERCSCVKKSGGILSLSQLWLRLRWCWKLLLSAYLKLTRHTLELLCVAITSNWTLLLCHCCSPETDNDETDYYEERLSLRCLSTVMSGVTRCKHVFVWSSFPIFFFTLKSLPSKFENTMKLLV